MTLLFLWLETRLIHWEQPRWIPSVWYNGSKAWIAERKILKLGWGLLRSLARKTEYFHIGNRLKFVQYTVQLCSSFYMTNIVCHFPLLICLSSGRSVSGAKVIRQTRRQDATHFGFYLKYWWCLRKGVPCTNPKQLLFEIIKPLENCLWKVVLLAS
jgi:hypothetical protein